jgi:hypothetical protein
MSSRFQLWCDEVDKVNKAIDDLEAREQLLRYRVNDVLTVDVNRTEQMIRIAKAGVVIMVTAVEATDLIDALLNMIESEEGEVGDEG